MRGGVDRGWRSVRRRLRQRRRHRAVRRVDLGQVGRAEHRRRGWHGAGRVLRPGGADIPPGRRNGGRPTATPPTSPRTRSRSEPRSDSGSPSIGRAPTRSSRVFRRLSVGPPGIPTMSSSWSNQSRPTVTYPLAPTGARTAGGSWLCHSRRASRPAQAAREPRSRCCVGNSAFMPAIRAATSRARRSGPVVTEHHLEPFGSWATGSKRWRPSVQARRERQGSSLGPFERCGAIAGGSCSGPSTQGLRFEPWPRPRGSGAVQSRAAT